MKLLTGLRHTMTLLLRKPFFTTIQYAVAGLQCMVLFLRGPQKRSGLIRYGSGKDIGMLPVTKRSF